MTAFSYVQEQVISEFTLALLKDTEVYEVINNCTGRPMRFGKNAGSGFFIKDCNEKLEEINPSKSTKNKAIFINEFCSGMTKTIYSSGRQSRGICDIYLSAGGISSNDY